MCTTEHAQHNFLAFTGFHRVTFSYGQSVVSEAFTRVSVFVHFPSAVAFPWVCVCACRVCVFIIGHPTIQCEWKCVYGCARYAGWWLTGSHHHHCKFREGNGSDAEASMWINNILDTAPATTAAPKICIHKYTQHTHTHAHSYIMSLFRHSYDGIEFKVNDQQSHRWSRTATHSVFSK